MLKSKLLILEQVKTYLQSNMTDKYERAQNKLLDDVERILNQEALNSEKLWYKCILTRNPLECQRYSLKDSSIIQLMDQYAYAFWVTEKYKATMSFDSVLYDIQQFIKEHKKKINNLEMIANIKAIEASSKEIDELKIKRADITENNKDSMMFVYDSMSRVKVLQNLSLPVTERLLWYTNSDSASAEYVNTINMLNLASVSIKARLVKVNVRRRWLKPDIFADSSYQMVMYQYNYTSVMMMQIW